MTLFFKSYITKLCCDSRNLIVEEMGDERLKQNDNKY